MFYSQQYPGLQQWAAAIIHPSIPEQTPDPSQLPTGTLLAGVSPLLSLMVFDIQ